MLEWIIVITLISLAAIYLGVLAARFARAHGCCGGSKSSRPSPKQKITIGKT